MNASAEQLVALRDVARCLGTLRNEPFETAWVYELPEDARDLRLLLPFGNVEFPFLLPT